jgi:hypothetical protein
MRQTARRAAVVVTICLSSAQLVSSRTAEAQAANYELIPRDSYDHGPERIYSAQIFDHVQNILSECHVKVDRSTFGREVLCRGYDGSLPKGSNIQTLFHDEPRPTRRLRGGKLEQTFWEIDRTSGLVNFCMIVLKGHTEPLICAPISYRGP